MSTQEMDTVTRETLQGWVPALAAESDLRAALEQAFDYRGDVTITLKSGEERRRLRLRSPNRQIAR